MKASQPDEAPDETPMETVIIYGEGGFTDTEGHAAEGVLKYFEMYEVISIIDSDKAGQAAGDVLEGAPTGIPIYRDLGTALAQARRAPDHLIVGINPTDGPFSEKERRHLLRAMKYGINIVNGGLERLNDDPEFMALLKV